MHIGMTVGGRVRDGRLHDTEVELALIVDQDDEPNSESRSQLDAHLCASKAELAAGAVIPFDEVLAEI